MSLLASHNLLFWLRDQEWLALLETGLISLARLSSCFDIPNIDFELKYNVNFS